MSPSSSLGSAFGWKPRDCIMQSTWTIHDTCKFAFYDATMHDKLFLSMISGYFNFANAPLFYKKCGLQCREYVICS